MSTNISVSNNTLSDCNSIIKKLMLAGIDCRVIETKSLVDNRIENGCLLTFGPEYSSRESVRQIWNKINDDFTCAHLKIDSCYSGCILNYINADYCRGK